MKIKPPGRNHKKRRSSTSYHYWLEDDKPKKTGRLGQLNKNGRAKGSSSEFIRLMVLLDDPITKSDPIGFLVKKARFF